MYIVLLTVTIVTVFGTVQGQSNVTFSCTSDAQAKLCNDEVAPIYYDCKANPLVNPNCPICLFGDCDVIFANSTNSDNMASTVTCANDTCVSEVCSPFALYDSNSYGFSCRDVYTDDYCTYCETCYEVSRDLGCDTDYRTTFCRFLPADNLNDIACYSNYGPHACDSCSDLLSSQTCDSLSIGALTPEQNETLCSIGPSCTLFPPSVNCTGEQAVDCQLCTFLMDNGFGCDYTPTDGPPPLQCLSSDGLFCSIINGVEPACHTEYTNSSCMPCNAQYNGCELLDVSAITDQQRTILCGSDDALKCGFSASLTYSDCLNESLSRDCDYCKATLTACNYTSTQPVENNTNIENPNCFTSNITECGYDVTFYPCAILYGVDYCIFCNEALDYCGIPEYDDDFYPPNVCDNEYFVSLCSIVIKRADCSDLLDQDTCDYCSNVVNVNCSSVQLDTDGALDEFCSNSTFDTCTSVLASYPSCDRNDCITCRARGTLCEDYFAISGIEEQSCFYENEDIYCRVFGSNITSCPATYSSSYCSDCQQKLISCSKLELDKLSVFELAGICFNAEACSSVSGVDSYCQQGEQFARFCDTCQGFSSVCDPYTGTYDTVTCDSDVSTLFCRAFTVNLTECEANYNAGYCSLCQSTLMYCPTITDLDTLTSNQTDIACQFADLCDVFLSAPSLCSQPDNSFICDICNGFQSVCNPDSSGTSGICSSETGYGCLIGYTYFPCYVTSDEYTCDFCKAVVDICPDLQFNIDYVPVEICSNATYLSSCSLIMNDQYCELTYDLDTCEFCRRVIDQCNYTPDYTIDAQVLDISCVDFYPTCQYFLQFSSGDTLGSNYTRFDSEFCSVLSSYCPGRFSDTQLNCTSEYDYFCSNLTTLDNCDGQYFTSTCYDCDLYSYACSPGNDSIDNGLDEFCSSTNNLFACSNVPVGPTCRYLIPEESFLCDVCLLYTEQCIDDICSIENSLTQCDTLYSNGTIPTAFSDQCLPCSLISGVCENYTAPNVSSSSVTVVTGTVTGSTSSSITTGTVAQPSMTVTTSTSTSTSTGVVTGTTSGTATAVANRTSTVIPSATPSVTSTATPSVTPAGTSTGTPSVTSNVASVTDTSAVLIINSTSTIVTGTSVVVSISAIASTSTVLLATTTTASTPILVGTTTSSSASRDTTTTSTITGTQLLTTATQQQTISMATSDTSATSSSTSRSTTTTTTTTTTKASTTTTKTTSTGRSTTVSSITRLTQTPSSTPVRRIVSFDDLTDEQKDNAVTLEFAELSRASYEANVDEFVSKLESFIRADSVNTSKRQSSDVRVMVVDESVKELSNNNLELSVIASQSSNVVISGSTLRRIVEQNGDTLASSIGAQSLTSVNEGLSDDLTFTSSSGLSPGVTAAIVILVLFIVIVAVFVTVILLYMYVFKTRKGKYDIGDYKYEVGSSGEIALNPPMRQNTESSSSVLTVLKNDETLMKGFEENEKEELEKRLGDTENQDKEKEKDQDTKF